MVADLIWKCLIPDRIEGSMASYTYVSTLASTNMTFTGSVPLLDAALNSHVTPRSDTTCWYRA
jgi:hypothetical protein